MNYSILEQNVLDSLETEEAKAFFMKKCERPREEDWYRYKAEEEARVLDFIDPLVDLAAKPLGEGFDAAKKKDLMKFFRARLENRHKR